MIARARAREIHSFQSYVLSLEKEISARFLAALWTILYPTVAILLFIVYLLAVALYAPSSCLNCRRAASLSSSSELLVYETLAIERDIGARARGGLPLGAARAAVYSTLASFLPAVLPSFTKSR